jgi:predicted DNA-binding protein YlxM (UPF0122 family)
MIRNTEYAAKRHKAIVERFYQLQRELFEQNPKLKGYIYPDYFYKEISEETNLSAKYIYRVIQNSITKKSKMTRL